MPLFDFFWSMLWFFLFIAWIWTVIVVITNIFRNNDIGGFAKALWVLFVIVVPWLGVLIYLIAHGDNLAQRRYDDSAAGYERRRVRWYGQ